MIAQTATQYAATALAPVEAQTVFELRRGPERLARWRLATLDWLLRQLEELRLGGDGLFSGELRTLVVAFAAAHDPVLFEELADTSASQLNPVHDAVFGALGRVMIELSELRQTPSWRDVERLLSEPTHEDQKVAA